MINQQILQKRAGRLLETAGITINGDQPWDIQVHDPSLFNDVLLRGTLGLGDGYINGKWDVASIDGFFEKIFLAESFYSTSLGDGLQQLRNAFINTQAGRRAFQVGELHYDLGNEMYELMLGESMGYSCGIYQSKGDDLATAQYNKFDNLCKNLHLKPGMKILEIGAGWGTFARHAAKHYGVDVVGLTVSKEQMAYAEKRCKGLAASFKLLDYRDIGNSMDGQFDRVVSIEMIEAVGKKNFKQYFETIERVLKPSGLFGMQAIIGQGGQDLFMSTRIFPNGLLPTQRLIIDNCARVLRVRHWQSIGVHYDQTLLDWEKNFVDNWPKIAKLKDPQGTLQYDEKFYRMWRYYLLSCAAAFRSGYIEDAQIVFSKHNAKSGWELASQLSNG